MVSTKYHESRKEPEPNTATTPYLFKTMIVMEYGYLHCQID